MNTQDRTERQGWYRHPQRTGAAPNDIVTDELVERVADEADIVAIIGEYVPLRRSGSTYRGPCPLHRGEGPAFSVDPLLGLFECFVCGERGDVFAFFMKLLGHEFSEAVNFVAAKSGLSVLDEHDTQGAQQESVALYMLDRPGRWVGALANTIGGTAIWATRRFTAVDRAAVSVAARPGVSREELADHLCNLVTALRQGFAAPNRNGAVGERVFTTPSADLPW